MARTSNLANVATVSRASKAWYPGGWDFTSGGAITGDLVEYANNVARDGSSGLLVEEGSTNEIRNPRFEGGTAGSPGASPTSFAVSASGYTRTYAFGVEGGWPYVDVGLSGSGGTILIFLNSGVTVTAADGDVWTLSAGMRVAGGSLTNVGSIKLRADERDGVTTENVNSLTVDPGSTHKRYFLSATLSGGGAVDNVVPIIEVSTSGAIDITLRIYAPQLEQKAYPTSPILPAAGSPAASDREADDIEVGNGAWSNDNAEGSLYAEIVLNNGGVSGAFPRLVSYGTDDNNEASLFVNQDTAFYPLVRQGGSTVASGSSQGISLTGAGQTYRAAVAFAEDDFAMSIASASQVTDSAGAVNFGTSSLGIGQSVGGIQRASSVYIKQIRYWPRRLTNAELEALVGN